MRYNQPFIEFPKRPFPRFSHIFRHAFGHNLVNGFSAFLFAATGPGAMILAVGTVANLPPNFIAAWIFAGYSLSGILSLLVCYLYRQPLTFGYSMPAVVIVGPGLMTLSLTELIGAYILSGVLILLLAATGLVRRSMVAIPEPIVMAMVAGVFLPYGLRMIEVFGSSISIAGLMILSYLAISAFKNIKDRFPPLLASLIAGVLLIITTGQFNPVGELKFEVVSPILFRPDFNMTALIEFVIPLTITVVGIHNTQGFGILRNAGFKPPENLATLLCGGGTVVYGFLGCVPAVVTGPANAILNTSGKKDWRFVGGLWFGLFFIAFGIFSPFALQLGFALPQAFVVSLAGLAMLPVLQSAFVAGFGGPFSLSVLVTFMTTVAGVSILGIGAAFWCLLFGLFVAYVAERVDFTNPHQNSGDKL